MNTYFVINAEGKICQTIFADSLKDAVAEAERVIDSDGSRWYEDRWRSVKSDKGNQVAHLRKR
jgi:hypothetical protein